MALDQEKAEKAISRISNEMEGKFWYSHDMADLPRLRSYAHRPSEYSGYIRSALEKSETLLEVEPSSFQLSMSLFDRQRFDLEREAASSEMRKIIAIWAEAAYEQSLTQAQKERDAAREVHEIIGELVSSWKVASALSAKGEQGFGDVLKQADRPLSGRVQQAISDYGDYADILKSFLRMPSAEIYSYLYGSELVVTMCAQTLQNKETQLANVDRAHLQAIAGFDRTLAALNREGVELY